MYKLNGNDLEHVFKEKDCGVTINFEPSFLQHISKNVCKKVVSVYRNGEKEWFICTDLIIFNK